MFSEWPSVETEILQEHRSVLHKYPTPVGRDVARSVVNSLFTNPPGRSFASDGHRNSEVGLTQLATNDEVKWTMEVICFGLTLTLSEYDTLKESVSIYIDWLSAVTTPKANVPEPVCSDPLPYVRLMISHFENLFIPRTDGSLNNQLVLCLSVLRAVQAVARDSDSLDRQTWEALLMFVLNVSNTLLAHPSSPNGLAEQICEQLMQTMFDVWMLSCYKCFPTPSLWKTVRILFSRWRHHPPVVDWWSKITSALTSRLLAFMYSPAFPTYKVPEEDAKYIPKELDNEHIAQTWFRVLHMISNPVELSNSTAITKSPKFMEFALQIESGFDVSQHPCLRMLPYIFLKAMKGVSSFVDAFLGLTNERRYEVNYPNVLMQIATPITPTTARKSGKVRKGTSSGTFPKPASPALASPSPSTISTTSSGSSATPHSLIDMHAKPTPHRPQCNSILHLFGEWLFDAALAGCKFDALPRDRTSAESWSRTPSVPYSISSTTSSSLLSVTPLGDNLVSNPMFDASEFPESSDAGRAEACGTLCRLMCCKKTGEHILPVYLSRFYLVLSQGLLGESKQVLASILLNSVDLMRIDLPGVACLLPALLTALESILPDKELQQFKPFLNTVELRRAAIHLLISTLPLPLHYTTTKLEDIQELWTGVSNNITNTSFHTFQSLKKRLLDLLIGALQCETDPINTQMILGALLLALHDSALFEAVGCIPLSQYRQNVAGVVQPSENEVVPVDTAYGLFVQIIHLVSQKLDSWKSDVSISLAALELLSGLAMAHVNMEDRHECRRAVHELCHYIVYQCERPPPQHKRELHSMIVTAFHTLATWLMEHPYLMEDKGCLHEVLEIIELGISGSKSKPANLNGGKQDPLLKADKELNPVSMRVMEAAEGLLILVFEHLGAFPTPCSPSSTSSLLDERLLLAHAHCGLVPQSPEQNDTVNGDFSMTKAVPSFRYFGLYGGLLLSILEQNLGNEQEPVPTVTVLIRGSSGRKAWTMQLRQTPRSDKLSPGAYLARPNRPSPLSQVPTYHRPRYKTFPEEVERIPLVKADYSIPSLSEVPNAEEAAVVEKLQHLIELQKRYDEEITKQVKEHPEKMPECIPSQPTHEFQTARLLLSHLNLLTLDSVKAKPQARLGTDLVMLNTSDSSFASDLEAFDSMSTRNHDTVFVFYLKAGQTEREEILANVSGDCTDVQPAFTELLLSLGWPVDLSKHPGWSGKVSQSWKLKDHYAKNTETIDLNKQGPGVFNGRRHILYYANATTEVAFIVPSLHRNSKSAKNVAEVDSADDKLQTRPKLTLDLSTPASTSSNLSQDSPTSPVNAKGKKLSVTQRPNLQPLPDTRVIVVWCEKYDNFDTFPLDKIENELLTEQETPSLQNKAKEPLMVIFIHPLESGLFRIYILGQNGVKGGVAVPLISGMVVSRRALGVTVRMTAMNFCSRRRLASDSYSPPHVRRKQRINDLLTKYQKRCTEPEFFTAMFTDAKRDEPMNCSISSGSTSSIASTHSALKAAIPAS